MHIPVLDPLQRRIKGWKNAVFSAIPVCFFQIGHTDRLCHAFLHPANKLDSANAESNFKVH